METNGIAAVTASPAPMHQGKHFAALILAEAGLKPLVLERGKAVEERVRDVAEVQTGQIDDNSPVAQITYKKIAAVTQDKKLPPRLHKIPHQLVEGFNSLRLNKKIRRTSDLKGGVVLHLLFQKDVFLSDYAV